MESDIFLHIRYEKKEVIENPKAFSPELTRRFRDFYDVKPLLEGVREQFPGEEK